MTVVPFNYPLEANPENISYDGIFISNGPGDPTMCTETIESLRVRHILSLDPLTYNLSGPLISRHRSQSLESVLVSEITVASVSQS